MKRTCLLLALLTIAAMLPPKPKKPHRSAVGVTQGSGAAALLAKKPKGVTTEKVLTWEWTPSIGNAWSNTVFIVWSSDNIGDPLGAWTPMATVTTNRWAFKAMLPQAFFYVTASNTVSCLVNE